MWETNLQGKELPKHKHCWDEMNPYENEIFVINTDEHRMNAMSKC